MATKFIELEQAAEMLGISADKLAEMREQHEIRGFRDGTIWKFKAEELERVKASLDAGGSELDLDETASGPANLDAADSVLLSEHELGSSGPVGSSTVIGQSATGGKGQGDLRVTQDAIAQSDIELAGDSMTIDSDSPSASGASSDVLGGGAEVDAGSDLQLPSDAAGNFELELSDSDTATGQQSDPAAGGDQADAQQGDSGSGSEIDLTGEDDELVLGGTGSDVIGASDSGISLGDPTDSGLSLESEPLDLAGSMIGDEALLLGEDDDEAESSSSSKLKSEDDFLLTPLDDSGGEESESSSQVIALDDPDLGFDASSATVMEAAGDAGMAMLEAELTEEEQTGLGPAKLIPAAEGAPIVLQQAAIPEAPYSLWNVLSLFVCIAVLTLSGMLIYDLVRQIWSWEGVHPVNSGMMDTILGMFR